jgi:glycosyltransferase involved in cell wall biosynthesis
LKISALKENPVSKRKQKVCLITPNHISTNPRLVKEALALEKAGYDVHIIFSQSAPFESGLDFDLLKEHPSWSYDVLDWSKASVKSKIVRAAFGLIQKLASLLFVVRKDSLICALLINRNYLWQVAKAKRVHADLFIAHNLGALPVARKASLAKKAKLGFDAEDFHRHETSNDVSVKSVIINQRLEEINFPSIDHFTAASPLIAEAYEALFPSLKATVILNVFPQPNPLTNETRKNDKLKLFWFSQTVGENRGIELIIDAIAQLDANCCELHLLGNANEEYRSKLKMLATEKGLQSQIVYHPPCAEKEIFSIAANCDIGLASETGVPLNRDICLTNKFFTYIQSGLFLAASNTKAQEKFIRAYPSVGKIYDKASAASLVTILRYYQSNREELLFCKASNLRLANEELNWEKEEKKFLELLSRTLNEVEVC